MYAWLQEAIAESADIVTASNRLARELCAVYDESQLAAGKTAWVTPSIHSWQDWQAMLLESSTDNMADGEAIPARIDACSASIVWEQCLRHQVPEGLLSFRNMARQTRRSWRLVCDWSVPINELMTAAGSDDERLFARTAKMYQNKMAATHWIDAAGLTSLIAELVTRRAVTLPPKILLAGFDRLTPSAERLFAAAKTSGCDVVVVSSPDAADEVAVAEFDDHGAEMRSAGAWARGLLANNPSARIAIVSPSLENEADRVHRLILEGLAPGWQIAGQDYRDAANVSYGRKLSTYPAVHIALLILKWTSTGLTGHEISQLLRSKCIGNDDVSGRAQLEYAFRKHPDQAWSTDAFTKAFRDRVKSSDVESFFKGLSEMTEFSAAGNAASGPGSWASRFDELLTVVQWPGSRVLDSREFQLINRWRNLLNEFARIETVTQKMKLSEAIQRLSALASDTIYQPEAAAGAVQVLGSLEAAGMQFDAVWISGMDAGQWPPSGKASAFISKALQKKFVMPDATPVDTLEFAQRVFARLVASAPECIVSWSRFRDDAELTISPLIDEIKTVSYAGPYDPQWFAAKFLDLSNLQSIANDVAPPVIPGERIRGGAYTVQRQATEPFAAFVYGRLGVTHAEALEPGLAARVRGTVIHDALHNLMAGSPGSHELDGWSDEQRQQRVAGAIDASLAGLVRHANATLRRILALERARLKTLLQEFIDAEIERGEFSVESVESKIDYQRGDVHLGLRTDRIDVLPDGSRLIIDYKTGAPRNFLRADGQPAELQLVVYADALLQPVGGLMLINLDSRAISYKAAGGSIEHGSGRNADSDDWNETLNAWITLVHRAIDGIAAGDVRINMSLSSAQARQLQILSRHEEIKRAD